MTGRLRTAATLPTPSQLLLLEAASLDGDAALEAWKAWSASVSVMALDLESTRILPALYDNLRRLGAVEFLERAYVSAYRRSWTKNRLLFRRTASAIEALESAGIPTLILKGAAMALRYYFTPAGRVMEDVDVLVPPARASEAMRLLRKLGFAPAPTTATQHAVAPSLRHSLNFLDSGRMGLDLHWHVSAEARRTGDDADFWGTSEPVLFEGTRTRALDATHQLYHVCAHAYVSDSPHLRWLVDARMLLARATVDWKRLVALAHARRFALPIAAALDWLRRELDAPVDPEVIAELAGVRIPLVDRLEHAHRSSSRPYTVGKVLLRMWCDHRRSTQLSGRALLGAFPDYLRRYYRVERRRELFGIGVRRVIRRALSNKDREPRLDQPD